MSESGICIIFISFLIIFYQCSKGSSFEWKYPLSSFFLVPDKSSSNKNLYPIWCVVTFTSNYMNEQVLDKRLLLKCDDLSHFAFYLVSFILPNVITVINIYIQYSVLNTIGNIEGQGWIFRDPVWLCAWRHAITGSGVFVKSLTLIRRGGGKSAPQIFKRLFLWNRKSDWPQTRL